MPARSPLASAVALMADVSISAMAFADVSISWRHAIGPTHTSSWRHAIGVPDLALQPELLLQWPAVVQVLLVEAGSGLARQRRPRALGAQHVHGKSG